MGFSFEELGKMFNEWIGINIFFAVELFEVATPSPASFFMFAIF